MSNGDNTAYRISDSAGDGSEFLFSENRGRPRLVIQRDGETLFELDFESGIGVLSAGSRMNDVARDFFSALSFMVNHLGAEGKRLRAEGTVIEMNMTSTSGDATLRINCVEGDGDGNEGSR